MEKIGNLYYLIFFNFYKFILHQWGFISSVERKNSIVEGKAKLGMSMFTLFFLIACFNFLNLLLPIPIETSILFSLLLTSLLNVYCLSKRKYLHHFEFFKKQDEKLKRLGVVISIFTPLIIIMLLIISYVLI